MRLKIKTVHFWATAQLEASMRDKCRSATYIQLGSWKLWCSLASILERMLTLHLIWFEKNDWLWCSHHSDNAKSNIWKMEKNHIWYVPSKKINLRYKESNKFFFARCGRRYTCRAANTVVNWMVYKSEDGQKFFLTTSMVVTKFYLRTRWLQAYCSDNQVPG